MRRRMIKIDGESKSLTDWSEIYGNSKPLILGRVKRGWTMEEAITKPARGYEFISPPRPEDEAKPVAVKRLKEEGRYADFLLEKQYWYNRGMRGHQAFYRALERFLPGIKRKPLAKPLRDYGAEIRAVIDALPPEEIEELLGNVQPNG